MVLNGPCDSNCFINTPIKSSITITSTYEDQRSTCDCAKFSPGGCSTKTFQCFPNARTVQITDKHLPFDRKEGRQMREGR